MAKGQIIINITYNEEDINYEELESKLMMKLNGIKEFDYEYMQFYELENG